jgi:hypothetical protein
MGVSVVVFILFDFVKYLTSGQSTMAGSGGGSYGQSVFILFMTGLALLGSGLYMLRVMKAS